MQNTDPSKPMEVQEEKTQAALPNPAGQVPPQKYYFETETKRLKEHYRTHQDELLGKKILFNNSTGVVRYFGGLKHEGKPAGSEEELWVGMEWDEAGRGKHNGTVNEHEYFKCTDKGGSLLKYEKIQFGYRLQTALFKRYFRPQELHHAKDIYESLKQMKEEQKEKETEGEKDVEGELKKKIHKIEYDAEAYISTIKKSKKIMIEFVGFDEIWTKINNLDKIQSISLAECRICDLGALGHLRSLFKSLKILSLEDNLISDWQQVYQLGYQLPELSELSLSYNHLHTPPHNFEDLNKISVVGREEELPLEGVQLFSRLKTLILIGTGLTWQTFFKIAPAFKNTAQFILCKNDLSDTQNIDAARLQFLQRATFFNLEETNLTKFSQIMALGKLPKLDKLILNKNQLGELGREIVGFEHLRYLSIQGCAMAKPSALADLIAFPELESVHVKHNPVGEKFGQLYVRMRAVAQVPKLVTINGAQLKKYERKDCEIFYLRQAFREYFAFKKVPDYDYDFQDFLEYCKVHHPNIQRLIKRYGNPYEVEKKEIQELIKQEVKTTEVKKGTGMVQVTIEYLQTESKASKKLPLSWTLSSLKNFFCKTTKIAINLLQLTCYAPNSEVGQLMTEDHKTLSYYNLNVGSRITVACKKI